MISPVALNRPALVVKAQDAFLDRLGLQTVTPRAIGRLRIWVTARRAGGGLRARTFDPPVRLELIENASGALLFFNRVLGADGVTREPYFPAGRYDILVEGDYYRPTRIDKVELIGTPADLTLEAARGQGGGPPYGALAVALEPGFAYPFPAMRMPDGAPGPTLLRGTVGVRGGDAAGYKVRVLRNGGVAPYVTAADGQWLLVFPEGQEDATVTLGVDPPEGAVRQIPDIAIRAGKSSTAPPIDFAAASGGGSGP